MEIPTVSFDDLVFAMEAVYEAVERRDPEDSAFMVGSIAGVHALREWPRQERVAIMMRLTLVYDLGADPAFKEWVREEDGWVGSALIHAAATVTYPNYPHKYATFAELKPAALRLALEYDAEEEADRV